MITQGTLVHHLHYDQHAGIFTRRIAMCNKIKIGDIAGSTDPHGYIAIRVCGRLYKAHRLAWLYVYGEFPNVVDHINGVKSDNRLVNLRNCTSKQNAENQKLRSNNKTNHRGVYWSSAERRYKAQVGHDRDIHHLGTFVRLADAVNAVRRFRDAHYTHDRTEYSA
jgi:HNH endonuclease